MDRDIIIGIIACVVGVSAILLHNSFARATIEVQNRTWGFNFGEKEVTISKVVIIIVGALFVLIGILVFLKKIHFN